MWTEETSIPTFKCATLDYCLQNCQHVFWKCPSISFYKLWALRLKDVSEFVFCDKGLNSEHPPEFFHVQGEPHIKEQMKRLNFL
jgi:hypothetical protein